MFYYLLVFAAVMAHFPMGIITPSDYLTVYYVVMLSAFREESQTPEFIFDTEIVETHAHVSVDVTHTLVFEGSAI